MATSLVRKLPLPSQLYVCIHLLLLNIAIGAPDLLSTGLTTPCDHQALLESSAFSHAHVAAGAAAESITTSPSSTASAHTVITSWRGADTNIAAPAVEVTTANVVCASPSYTSNVAAASKIPELSRRSVYPYKTVSRSTDDVLVFKTSFDFVCLFTNTIAPPSGHEPPVPVIIASPKQNGTYPVILFEHGFLIPNCNYTQLFELLASSGYIVVAPQVGLSDFNPDCTEEIEKMAAVANWIPISLASVLNATELNENVVPDMSKLVMAGHSRGGKIAFAMVLGKASTKVPRFSALVALDPVDGTSVESIMYPPIVAIGCNHTRNQITIPVLILGTGYGSKKGILGVSCAPAGCGHAAYSNCSSAPIMYELVASDYGHLDFLDSSLQFLTRILCKSAGGADELLHDFSSELIVAFLQFALEGKADSINYIVDNWESACIKLEEPQIYIEDDALYVQERVQI